MISMILVLVQSRKMSLCEETSPFIESHRHCWHRIWPDLLCGLQPNTAGMRPMACGHNQLPLSSIPRGGCSPGSVARHQCSEARLAVAKYTTSFHYVFPCLSVSSLFGQSRWNDRRFIMSIRTRLISTLHDWRSSFVVCTVDRTSLTGLVHSTSIHTKY